MSDEGWVRLGDIEHGGLFETADGSRWVKARQHSERPGFVRLLPVGPTQNTTVRLYREADTPVRPLTAVRLHPSLRGSDLPGLCAAVLREPNEGTMGRLLDWLGDALGRDPDVAAATRERCAKVAEIYAVQAFDSRDAERYGSPPWVLESGRQRAALDIADIIRGVVGRPAATAAACGWCDGTGSVRAGEVAYPCRQCRPH